MPRAWGCRFVIFYTLFLLVKRLFFYNSKRPGAVFCDRKNDTFCIMVPGLLIRYLWPRGPNDERVN